LKTQEAITKVCYRVLPHPLNSPHLAPSDFHLFGALKGGIHGMEFEGDVIRTVRTWLHEQDKAYADLFLLGARAYKWTDFMKK
jgi:hypothetical protein